MDPVVLLSNTSWWPCASRMAIALRRAGCRVEAICPSSGHPLLKTKAVQKTYHYSPIHPVDSLLEAITSAKPDLVVPCDDRAVQHLHELHARAIANGPGARQVADLIERSLGSPESFAIVNARDKLLETAHEEGIRVPDSQSIETIEKLKSWHKVPYVLKADGTWGGLGVRITDSFAEAEQFFKETVRPLSAARAFKRLLVDRDPFWLKSWWNHSISKVIVQSHVEGRPANCGVFCWNGEVLAGIAVEVVTARGATGSAVIVRVIDNVEMMRAAELLARRLRMSGFFGLDFVIEESSGSAFLIEMNPRCTPLCHLPLGTGRDMIEAVFAQLTGNAIRETKSVSDRDTIAYFPQAWHWDSSSKDIESSFQDVPWEEPELVKELLLLPWPERSILARISARLQRAVLPNRGKTRGSTRVDQFPEKAGTRD